MLESSSVNGAYSSDAPRRRDRPAAIPKSPADSQPSKCADAAYEPQTETWDPGQRSRTGHIDGHRPGSKGHG